MRQAQRTKGTRKAVANVSSLPAPIGGWNARDSLAEMSPTDAVVLTNWYPATTELQARYGHAEHATGLPSQVETLMAYISGTTEEMFGACGSEIYDVTAAGAVGAADVTGLSNARWQSVNYTVAGGSYLLAVNGADKMRYYNGTAWDYDGAASLTVTGVNTAACNSIMVHKNRVWLAQNDSLKVWYLPTSSIAGAANTLDLSAVAQLGGYVVAIGTWTIDAGTGIDDLFVAVTSQGEIIVYAGTDPTSASTWGLKGVWRLGSPLGRRCLYKYGGDLLILSQDGVLPLSGALQSSRVNPKVALTDKIQSAISDAATSYGANFGWQLLYIPQINQLWVNVPISEGSAQQQYVMNTISKAWCNYEGWAANCWELFNESPYFGGDGVVYKAWTGLNDNGSAIQTTALQAFNDFGTPGLVKRFTMTRPVFRTSGDPYIESSLNVDFDLSYSTAPLVFVPTPFGEWDVGLWDTAIWGAGLGAIHAWQGTSGVGYYGAPQMRSASSGIDVRWVSTDIVMETGAIL